MDGLAQLLVAQPPLNRPDNPKDTPTMHDQTPITATELTQLVVDSDLDVQIGDIKNRAYGYDDAQVASLDLDGADAAQVALAIGISLGRLIENGHIELPDALSAVCIVGRGRREYLMFPNATIITE